MREAIVAALVAACSHGDLIAAQPGGRLSKAWDTAWFTAFDAACPPGKFESWARKSLPTIAAFLRTAKLETTSPERSDAIRLSAVAIFESLRREPQAEAG